MASQCSPDPCPAPDTAMGTGNDDAEPGDRYQGQPLDPDELAVLADLRGGGGEEVVTEAEEDSPAVADAVDNDTVVTEQD